MTGLEIVCFVGAIALLAALIYGTISYRHRNKGDFPGTQAPNHTGNARDFA